MHAETWRRHWGYLGTGSSLTWGRLCFDCSSSPVPSGPPPPSLPLHLALETEPGVQHLAIIAVTLPLPPLYLAFQTKHGLQHLIRVDVRRGISMPGSQPQKCQRDSVRQKLQARPGEKLECKGGGWCWFRGLAFLQCTPCSRESDWVMGRWRAPLTWPISGGHAFRVRPPEKVPDIEHHGWEAASYLHHVW